MSSFVDPASPFYVSEFESSGRHSFVQRIGTSNPLFPWHEEGTEFMPARPATPVGDDFVFEMIAEDLSEYLDALMGDTRHA